MPIDPDIQKRLIGLDSTYQDPYPVQVHGEASFKKNILKICVYVDEEVGYNDDTHQAALYLEDDNPFDPGNAVRVEINDIKVGYLTKADAKKYRRKLKEIGAPENAIAICGASIRGGFMKSSGLQADFGVRLDFDLATLKQQPLKFR